MASWKNKQVIDDVDDVITWLEKRNKDISTGKTNITELEMPVLARVICGGEDTIARLSPDDKKLYSKHFEKNKKALSGLTLSAGALGVGSVGVSVASIASGASAAGTIAALTTTGSVSLGLTAASGLSLASMGATAFVPVLWPVGISMLLIGVGAAVFKNKKTKENVPRSNQLEKIFEESRTNAQQCSQKIKNNNQKIQIILSEKLKKAKESLSKETEKIKIIIDDALNSDQNLRIMQYQEIVLKQYNSQNEIRKAFADLVEVYNLLVAENEKLARQIAAYEATMKICGCANNYLE